MNKTNMVIAVFMAALVIAWFSLYSPVAAPPKDRETFAQKEIGMPVSGVGMGPYDNVSVPGASGWLMNESAPQGASPVGGQPNVGFMESPRVSQSCCPSPFSSDAGCVCLSEQDRSTMSSRGGNKV